MFCEKCGNQVADGQPFCSICGAPLSAPVNAPQQPAAPAYGQAPGYGYAKPQRARPPKRPGVSLLNNFQAMTAIEKLCLLGTLGLFCLTFFLFQLPTIKYGYSRGVVYNMGWLLVFTNLFHMIALGTLILAFVGALQKAFFLLIPAVAGFSALIMFVISWGANSYYLSVAGWFYFIFLLFAVAASALYFVQELMNGY